MTRTTFLPALLFGALLTAAPVGGTAHADTVHLINGSTIDCMVIGKRDDVVVLMIGNLGRMTIPEKDIKRIEKNARTGYVSSERGTSSKPKEGGGFSDKKTSKKSPLPISTEAMAVTTGPELTQEERQSVQDWVYDLTRQDARKRTRAERKLREFGPRTIPYVLPAAQHQSDWTRAAAFRIFKAVGDVRVADSCVAGLGDQNRWVRKLAWETLSKISKRDYYFPWDDSATPAERDRAATRWAKWWELEKRKLEEAAADAEAIRKAEKSGKSRDKKAGSVEVDKTDTDD